MSNGIEKHYAALGLPSDAPPEAVRAACATLLRTSDPDRFPSNSNARRWAEKKRDVAISVLRELDEAERKAKQSSAVSELPAAAGPVVPPLAQTPAVDEQKAPLVSPPAEVAGPEPTLELPAPTIEARQLEPQAPAVQEIPEKLVEPALEPPPIAAPAPAMASIAAELPLPLATEPPSRPEEPAEAPAVPAVVASLAIEPPPVTEPSAPLEISPAHVEAPAAIDALLDAFAAAPFVADEVAETAPLPQESAPTVIEPIAPIDALFNAFAAAPSFTDVVPTAPIVVERAAEVEVPPVAVAPEPEVPAPVELAPVAIEPVVEAPAAPAPPPEPIIAEPPLVFAEESLVSEPASAEPDIAPEPESETIVTISDEAAPIIPAPEFKGPPAKFVGTVEESEAGEEPLIFPAPESADPTAAPIATKGRAGGRKTGALPVGTIIKRPKSDRGYRFAPMAGIAAVVAVSLFIIFQTREPADSTGSAGTNSPAQLPRDQASQSDPTTPAVRPAGTKRVRPEELFAEAEKEAGAGKSTQAAELYRVAADRGHARAQYKLAVMCAEGIGTATNWTEAAKWYGKAGENGIGEAQFRLGVMNLHGVGVDTNSAEALKLFQRAAEAGDVNAVVSIGLFHLEGKHAPKDYVEAAKNFRKAAEARNQLGYALMGMMHDRGLGVPAGNEEAAKWYQLAANEDQNSMDAPGIVPVHRQAAREIVQHTLAVLGLMYRDGDGVMEDPKRAFAILEKSAKAGSPEGQFHLAWMHQYGIGTETNLTAAAQLYRQAADQEHPDAQFNIGLMLDQGIGTAADPVEASKWYERAAEKGHTRAQVNLGWMRQIGRGGESDVQKAAEWYRSAAELGDSKGQLLLGQCYMQGQGVSTNLVEAYKWIKLASAATEPEATEHLDELGVQLSFSQIAEALKRVREFEKRRTASR